MYLKSERYKTFKSLELFYQLKPIGGYMNNATDKATLKLVFTALALEGVKFNQWLKDTPVDEQARLVAEYNMKQDADAELNGDGAGESDVKDIIDATGGDIEQLSPERILNGNPDEVKTDDAGTAEEVKSEDTGVTEDVKTDDNVIDTAGAESGDAANANVDAETTDSTDAPTDAAPKTYLPADTILPKVIIQGNPPKAQVARAIFNQELEAKGPHGLVRKTIVDRFIAEAGLTEKGAPTYYQNFRKEAGLTGSNSTGTVIIPSAAPVVTEAA